jgi:hypothetical protein
VELVDATMIGLARGIDMFQPTLEAFVRGAPAALLLVEFAEEPDENARRLKKLHELFGDLGFNWSHGGACWGVVGARQSQAAITELRTAGLNIMMSMKEAGKPISFVEDCAVPLEHLATRRGSPCSKNDTRHRYARLGRLPARAADLEPAARQGRQGVPCRTFVRDKGSHSGEHGDGIVRSEFHEFVRPRLVRASGSQDRFVQHLTIRQIVRRSSMIGQLPLQADYHAEMTTRLDWSATPAQAADSGRSNVQQQRRLPRLGGRRDVPELSGHPRGARRHARPRQHAAARDHRAAWAGCVNFR